MTRDASDPPSAESILDRDDLTRDEKVDRLRQMAYDAREILVAREEGMTGPAPPDLERIQNALRALGASESGSDTKQ